MFLKESRVYGMCLALFLILPLASCGPEHSRTHTPHGEILIVNDTDTQVTFYITTEKYGRKGWTWSPGKSTYPGVNPDNTGTIRLRVSGEDEIEIGDWGKAYIRDVAKYSDGVWNLSLRQARRELRHNR